jgi:cytochrome c556
MKLFAGAAFAAVCSMAVVAAVAQTQAPPTPQEQAQSALEVRQSIFKLQGWNMAPLGAMARNRIPFDAAVVKLRAERIAHTAAMISDAFQADTREFELETEALDRIWENKDAFNGKASDLVKAANDLAAAAAGGDQGATMQAIGALGQACGSCHDDFREEN